MKKSFIGSLFFFFASRSSIPFFSQRRERERIVLLSLQLLDRRSAHTLSRALVHYIKREREREKETKKSEREKRKKDTNLLALSLFSLSLSSSFAHSTTYTEVGRDREKKSLRSLIKILSLSPHNNNECRLLLRGKTIHRH